MKKYVAYLFEKHPQFCKESLKRSVLFIPVIERKKILYPLYPLLLSALHTGRSGEGLYGDVLREMDEGVGQILNKIRQLGQFFSRQFSARIFLLKVYKGPVTRSRIMFVFPKLIFLRGAWFSNKLWKCKLKIANQLLSSSVFVQGIKTFILLCCIARII